MIELLEEKYNLELTKDFAKFCNIPKTLNNIDKQIEKIALLSRNISSHEATSRILLLMKAKDNLILKYQIMKRNFLKLSEEIIEILQLMRNGKSINEISNYLKSSIRTVQRRLSVADKIYRRIKNGKI